MSVNNLFDILIPEIPYPNISIPFDLAFHKWMVAAQNILDQDATPHKEHFFRRFLSYEIKNKFIVVWINYMREDGTQDNKSAYAFVACKSFDNNKQLGEVKEGMIFKPQTFRAPAKHHRGNIYDSDNGLSCVGPYGIAYLK